MLVLVKLVPVTVSCVAPDPTVAEVIERVVMLGVFGVEELEPPPLHPAVTRNNRARTSNVATEKRRCISLPDTVPDQAQS